MYLEDMKGKYCLEKRLGKNILELTRIISATHLDLIGEA
jgi:hypothetical protein